MADLLDLLCIILIVVALGMATELTDEADHKTLERDRDEFERKQRALDI